MEPKDVLKSVFQTKEDLATTLDTSRELTDAPSMWVINRMVSMFPECVLDVNEINIIPKIDDTMQYDFLRFRLGKRTKTYSPWIKPDKIEDLEYIKRYFQYSEEKARYALTILTPEQVTEIRDAFFEGGVVSKTKTKTKKELE